MSYMETIFIYHVWRWRGWYRNILYNMIGKGHQINLVSHLKIIRESERVGNLMGTNCEACSKEESERNIYMIYDIYTSQSQED